jgi:hypothetical protein
MRQIGFIAQVHATGKLVSSSAPRFVGYVGVPGRHGKDGSIVGSVQWPNITGKPIPQTDVFAIATDGAQTIALSHTPLEPAQLGFHINGVRQHDRTDFTLVGSSLTLGASWNLFSDDVLEFSYTY